jgi:hypothetical protein
MDLIEFFHKKYYPDLSAEQVAAAFGNPEVAEAAYNYVHKKYYPDLPPEKVKRIPIIVNNPNDPRLVYYNDSNDVYKRSKLEQKMLLNDNRPVFGIIGDKNNSLVETKRKIDYIKVPKNFDESLDPNTRDDNPFNDHMKPVNMFRKTTTTNTKDGSTTNGDMHVKTMTKEDFALMYKKPIQPYVYQKPSKIEPILNTSNAIQLNTIAPQEIILPPTYTSEKQMYQGRGFMEATGLRPGMYHPEEVEEKKKSGKKHF